MQGMRWAMALLWGLAAAGAASAQVHRCPAADGSLVLQQTPCPGGAEVQVRPIPMMGGTLLGDPARASADAATDASADEKASPRAASSAAGGAPRLGAKPARSVRGCPSTLTIRNAEVGASSITLSPQERRQRQAEVARMRACRG